MLPHRKIGVLLLSLVLISFTTIIAHGIFEENYNPVRVLQYFYVMSFIGAALIFSIIWNKGYYIQIGLYCCCFIASSVFDGLNTPYSLIFLVLAIVSIYRYHIKFHVYVVAFSCAMLFIATLFGTPDFSDALSMLAFSVVIAIVLYILLGGSDEEANDRK